MSVHLNASYGRQQILHDLHFDMHPQEALGLIGASGAGKTTVVLALLGLLPWRGGEVTGEVLLEGRDLLAMPEREVRRLRGNRLALIPQSPMSALNRALTLRAHFEETWRAHERFDPVRLDDRVRELMDQMQLPSHAEFLSRKPGQISAGQAQRVMIALGLLHRPALLIADEPTSALDPATQAEIIRLLRRLNRESGTALLYISHDLLSVLQLCDRVAVLDNGAIVESLASCEIEQARHGATISLLRALPVPAEILLRYRSGNAESMAATC